MPPRRHRGFADDLTDGVQLHAGWEIERDVVRYAVLLTALVDGHWRAVELFDCSHGERNDRHRYSRDGCKGPAEPFHHGMPGEGLRAAISLIRADHQRMIERWQRRTN